MTASTNIRKRWGSSENGKWRIENGRWKTRSVESPQANYPLSIFNSAFITMPFNDLREFIDAARALGEVKEIHGAHWNLEIGALTELFAFKEPSPLVLFDQIPGYPAHFRVASNLISNPVRSGLPMRAP